MRQDLSPADVAAILMAQWTREAIAQTHRKRASEQHGEAFNPPLTIQPEGAGQPV